MKVSTRGKGLAVRLPVSLVRELNLKSGDEIDIHAVERLSWIVQRRDDPLASDFTIGPSASRAGER
jgi:antitoxin component of MazEF toxin-antitoxin module